MTLKLIVTDMDETFLRANKTYDIEKATSVLKTLAEKNIVFAIASGNFIPLLQEYFTEDVLENIYLAGDDGNVLANNKEILRQLPISSKDAQDIFNFFTNIEGYFPIYSTGKQAYVNGPLHEKAAKEISLYYGDYVLVNSFDEIPKEKKIVKIEAYSEEPLEKIKKIMNEINDRFADLTAVTSGETWLDVYHKDGGKGSAVRFLQEKYNISKDETMCFGDSLNDLSMMKEAKFSMAMKNADEELKEHCHFEIGTSENQAVLEILEEFIEENNLDFLVKYRR